MCFDSTIGRSEAGTTTVMSPAPMRSAADPARHGAPVIPGDPPTMWTLPASPLWKPGGTDGEHAFHDAFVERLGLDLRVEHRPLRWIPDVVDLRIPAMDRPGSRTCPSFSSPEGPRCFRADRLAHDPARRRVDPGHVHRIDGRPSIG